MTAYLAITSQQVKQAAAALKKLRPAYAYLLNFYEKIFVAQEYSKIRIKIDPIKISYEILALKKKEKFSLNDLSEFALEPDAASGPPTLTTARFHQALALHAEARAGRERDARVWMKTAREQFVALELEESVREADAWLAARE